MNSKNCLKGVDPDQWKYEITSLTEVKKARLEED